MKVSAVLLAAGEGKRMNSSLPKVLHPLAGQPMVFFALQAASQASSEQPVLVTGFGGEAVRESVGKRARFAHQEQQLGTGHAVMQAEGLLKGKTDLLIVSYADMPLLRAETFQQLVETQKRNPGPITILTVEAEDPRGFGRVMRSPEGAVSGIVEEAQATPAQLETRELNVGAYCFSADWLWQALARLKASPKGEFYLTDTVELAVQAGLAVQAIRLEDPQEAIGVNTRIHLAEAEQALRSRINREHMLAGVTLVDPSATYIDAGVRIGRDTVIWPNCHLHGETSIGEDCLIGPDTLVRDSKIEKGCRVVKAFLEGAWLEENVEMGPFARLRPGAHLCRGVHMGNFGEVKDSTLGEGVKLGHFSYIGNTTIGAGTNIGAGTITCNYDGKQKHATEIGEDVFIGSDSMLVAPLKIGDRARTGAGSVVTKDIPPDSLAVGMPARVIRKLKQEGKK